MKNIMIILGLILLVGCIGTPPSVPINTNTCVYEITNVTPYTCDNSTKACMYGDTTLNTACFCNGTDWVRTNNESAVC